MRVKMGMRKARVDRRRLFSGFTEKKKKEGSTKMTRSSDRISPAPTMIQEGVSVELSVELIQGKDETNGRQLHVRS